MQTHLTIILLIFCNFLTVVLCEHMNTLSCVLYRAKTQVDVMLSLATRGRRRTKQGVAVSVVKEDGWIDR